MKKIMAIMVGLTLMAGTAYAGSQNLTESELDGVSAQGLQTINNDNRTFKRLSEQDNNLDSIQLEHDAQSETITGGIVNSAKSAVNASANIMNVGVVKNEEPNGDPKSIVQTNTNMAANHENKSLAFALDDSGALAVAANVNKETQRINNMRDSIIDDQDNNNNSIQLIDQAQAGSRGVSIINASTSAVNFGLNAVNAVSVTDDSVTQTNTQYAGNMNNSALALAFNGYSATAWAVNGESGPTQVIINAPNTVIEGEPGLNQNNNNNSVQLNDNAQTEAQVASIINSAQSAVNASGNLASIGAGSGAVINQTNDNEAKNHVNVAVAVSAGGQRSGAFAYAKNVNKQTQKIYNRTGPEKESLSNIHQDNNNNTVQLNHNAQQNARGTLIVNSSVSAVNSALNGLNTGEISQASNVSQSNTQVASNMSNTALASGNYGMAIAANWEQNGATQEIVNQHSVDSEIIDQDNNNNSVQVNNNAQEFATALAIVNSAKSAVNSGANMATTGNITGSSVSQSNDNTAKNHVNVAIFAGDSGMAIAGNKNKQTQNIKNSLGTYEGELSLIEDQDNNNNSVQVNDNGQRDVTAVALVNAAGSSVNDAMSILNAGVVTDSRVSQTNNQSALNYDNLAVSLSRDGSAVAGNAETSAHPGQWVKNVHATIKQENNNNSVQLNDQAQADILVGRVVNAAGSAVNVGSNLMAADAVNGSNINQSNHQYASNHNNIAVGRWAVAGNLNKQTQLIENCFCTDLEEGHQNNNMNSVQLNHDAQRSMVAINAVNSAHSAVNVAYNIMTAGTVSDSHLEQNNTNTAINFSNIAIGTTAISGNAELSLF